MNKALRILLILTLTCYFSFTGIDFSIPRAKADLNHTQIFPHIKVFYIGYRSQWDADQLEFIENHHDLVISGHPFEGAGDLTRLRYNNYYCMFVGYEEYEHAQAWAQSHGVDFESFFIHYAEETEVTMWGDPQTYVLPAGSRVPTYGWYGTGGDLTKYGARIVTNPGNPNFRAWKLDSLAERMGSVADGIFVDNTTFRGIPKTSVVVRGGTIAEYNTTDPGPAYGDDILRIFAEFKQRFGNTKVQVPNVTNVPVDDERMYPYVWGVFREFVDNPQGFTNVYSMLDKQIADSTAAGVKANLIGTIDKDPRYDMPLLANFYLIKNETTYFMPHREYLASGYSADPRINQWYEAVAYNVGQPKAPRYLLAAGIDPSSPLKDTMTATVTKSTPSLYRLTDASKNWTDGQWKNLWIVFPSGYSMKVFNSGSNWVELYNPSEIPTNDTYWLGTYRYEVMAREFDNALVVFKPLPSWAVTERGDPSVTIHSLPATADNPSGQYYLLNSDGTLSATPITTISLRNTDGAVLIKESALNQVTISKNVNKNSASRGETLTYTIYYGNHTQNQITNVKLEDPIPAGTTYVANSATNGGTCTSTKCTWNLGDLVAGVSGSVQFKVKIE